MAYDNDTTIRLSMTDSNFDEYVEVDVTHNKYTSRSNITYTKLMHIDNQQKIYQNETFKNDYCSEDEFDDSMWEENALDISELFEDDHIKQVNRTIRKDIARISIANR